MVLMNAPKEEDEVKEEIGGINKMDTDITDEEMARR